jgi:hypothetical protein
MPVYHSMGFFNQNSRAGNKRFTARPAGGRNNNHLLCYYLLISGLLLAVK